jgi:hypothetical protein
MAAIINLSGLWNDDDDDNNDNDTNDTNDTNDNGFEEQYVITSHDICNEMINIRQFSFHVANANFIWPGTIIIIIIIIIHHHHYYQ